MESSHLLDESSLKILLVDDHEIVLAGLKTATHTWGMNTEIYSALNYSEAFELLINQSFNLIILDLNFRDISPLELFKRVSVRARSAPIIIYSMYDEKIFAKRLYRLGAKSYVSKELGLDVLRSAMLAAREGRRYLPLESEIQIPNKNSKSAVESLTDNEIEIAVLLAKGRSIKQIEAIFNLRKTTVSTYKSRIFRKLNVDNVIDLYQVIFSNL